MRFYHSNLFVTSILYVTSNKSIPIGCNFEKDFKIKVAFSTEIIMLHKIETSLFIGNGPIRVLYPGRALGRRDTGIGTIGRIDHAFIAANTVIGMHPHVNDEILSYFRSGEAEHSDSEGIAKMVGKQSLMLMRAGKQYLHEEKIMGAIEPFEGLQIFIRPGVNDLQPRVDFHDLESLYSAQDWRLLAGPTEDAPLQFSSSTWIYDTLIEPQESRSLPKLAKEDLTYMLYIFNGSITINGTQVLHKKEGLIIHGEEIQISTSDVAAELVLFVTDEASNYFDEGMFSGNMAR
jgi:redox-sensitive bicupin YhaK (pirin superfamily)